MRGGHKSALPVYGLGFSAQNSRTYHRGQSPVGYNLCPLFESVYIPKSNTVIPYLNQHGNYF
jgi:hypothetical protein